MSYLLLKSGSEIWYAFMQLLKVGGIRGARVELLAAAGEGCISPQTFFAVASTHPFDGRSTRLVRLWLWEGDWDSSGGIFKCSEVMSGSLEAQKAPIELSTILACE